MQSAPKEKVLKEVRKALIKKSSKKFPSLNNTKNIYKLPKSEKDDLGVLFAEQFSQAAGNFIFCENEEILKTSLHQLISEQGWEKVHAIDPDIQKMLDEKNIGYTDKSEDMIVMDIGITMCEFLVARSGSIVVSSKQTSGRRMVVFPPVHIAIAYSDQLVPHVKDALVGLKKRYGSRLPSQITAITGPSRTADIEKTLILGAHGPKEVYVLLTDRVPSK